MVILDITFSIEKKGLIVYLGFGINSFVNHLILVVYIVVFLSSQALINNCNLSQKQ